MATAGEKRALLFLAAIAAMGVIVGAWKRAPGTQSDVTTSAALDRQIASVDSATALDPRHGGRVVARGSAGRGRGRLRSQGIPAAESADSIILTPRPQARAWRPGSARDTGIALPADPMAVVEARRRAVSDANRDAQARLDELAEARLGAHIPVDAPSKPPTQAQRHLIDLDTADSLAIADLPVLSPAAAGRIVADRRRRGPFGSLDGLRRVPGITLAMTDKLSRYVTFSRAGSAPAPVLRFRKVPGHRAILDTLKTRGQLHPSGPAP